MNEPSAWLDERAARTDLTDRECAKILGGCIGSLSLMSDVETARRAVRWWADNDGAWAQVAAQVEHARSLES